MFIPLAVFLLYALRAGAAVEPFRTGAPVRWWLLGIAALFAVAAALAWRRTTWRSRTIAAGLGVAFAVAFVAWPSPTSTHGTQAVAGSASAHGAQSVSAARLAEIDSSFRALEDGDRETPRDHWDPDYVVAMVGRDPQRLFAWVRDNTYWIPYRGELRGPVGVLMDREGNSLDRALLLATLLETAGVPVRLAHGELRVHQALGLLPGLVARGAVAFTPPVAFDPVPRPNVRNAAAQYGLDGTAIARRLDVEREALTRASLELRSRVADQTDRLLHAVAEPDANAEWRVRFDSAMSALRDHWWVEERVGERWVDLDLLDSATAAPAHPLTVVSDTLSLAEVASAPIHQEIAVRVIAEQWAGGRLTEHTALEHVLRPSDVIGQPIVLQIWPMELVGDSTETAQARDQLRSIALDEERWVASLMVGRESVAMAGLLANGDDLNAAANGGPMGGLGGAIAGALGRAGGGAAPAHKELTAVWLEYEFRVPGTAPRLARRAVFDLIGPAARAAAPPPAFVLDSTKRLTRSLSLMMRTEILPLNCRFAPEFVRHLVSSSVLGAREFVRAAARGTLVPGAAATDSLIGRAAPSVSPLYALAIARMAWSRDARLIDIDQPGLLTRHVYPAPRDTGLVLRDVIDIVANDVGVSLVAPDAFRVRLAQGVFDTNAESLLRQGASTAGNVGDAFAASRNWTTITAARAQVADRVRLGDDARHRIRDDLAAGYVVVAPASAVPVFDGSFVGWWQIDRASGRTLGFGEGGWGAGPEYSALNTRARLTAPAFKDAMLRFSVAFTTQYLFCLASVADPQIEKHGFRSGLRLGIVSSVHDCVGDAFAIGVVSAVLPLVFLTIEAAEVGATVKAPPDPVNPLGKTQPDLGETQPDLGNTQPDLGKTQPDLGKTQPDLGKTQPAQPKPPQPQPPDADPTGKTQPDPSKTQRDPKCQPLEPDEPLPNSPPETLAEAQRNYRDALAASKAASEASMEATGEYLRYTVNRPNSSGFRWHDADVSKWDPTVAEALRNDMMQKQAASRAAADRLSAAWRELKAAANAEARARGAAGKGGFPPPNRAPAGAPVCAAASDKAMAGAAGLGGDGS